MGGDKVKVRLLGDKGGLQSPDLVPDHAEYW